MRIARLRKIFILILCFILMGVLIYFPISLSRSETGQTFTPPPIQPSIDFSKQTPAPISQVPEVKNKLKQTAWIPAGVFTAAFASLQANAQYFDSVSPVWYHLKADGRVQETRTGYEQLRNFTKQRGIKLIPTIAGFSADEVKTMLNNADLLKAHQEYLVGQVDKYDYDGLDIDYESFYIDDRAEFLGFMRYLRTELVKRDKVLTIAVVPAFTEHDAYTTFKQTRSVTDYSEICEYVHELRIMTYEATSGTNLYPGPVAPLDWVEANIRYAKMHCESEKIFMGMPMYGYNGWGDKAVETVPYLGMPANPGGGTAGATTNDSVQRRVPTQLRDFLEESSKEKVKIYMSQGVYYIIYYPDVDSARPKFELANTFNIGGVAHWRMGSEDTRIYALRDQV